MHVVMYSKMSCILVYVYYPFLLTHGAQKYSGTSLQWLPLTQNLVRWISV